MAKASIQRRMKDEIKEACAECGSEHLIAYWDYELEYYIYLSESPFVCETCQVEEAVAEAV